MTFVQENFELYLLIFVRITGFLYTAPFFSLKNVPIRIKIGISIFLSILLLYTISSDMPQYNSVIEYAILITKEVIVGVLMGFFANIAYYIISFSGQIIDMEIGFSMVNQLDPLSNIQTTISSNFYGYLILLMMMITNLHHFFIKALVDSYQVVPLGKAVFNPGMYVVMVRFITDYFIIGFRIVLPVFAAIMIVNTILAILAKIAPQMNMFVVGMQLKLFVGIFVLILIVELIPAVSDFIFNEMMTMLKSILEYM
ncbi:MAG: putative rane protein [Herbinix sp.]|jgi:flagellar biosynthetic protein FliR|nr:putative rane protein [Herbinix sp.]